MAKTDGLKFLSTHQQKNNSSSLFVYNKVGMVEAGLPSLGGFGPSHLRPDNGIAGVKCFMKANHFFVDLLDMDLHDYDVTITPEVACAAKEAKLLMFSSERQARTAKEALLQALLTTRYCALGRSFYSPDIGGTLPLGKGLESRIGFYQRIRSTQMGLSLSIDMSFTTFMDPLPVIDFVMQLLKWNGSSRPLYSADRLKIEKALSGVEVEVLYRGKIRSTYRIFGLTSQATQDLTFAVDDIGTMKSVVEYFQETYELLLDHIQWPCLLVGNRQRPTYLPMEVCKIVEGQRYFQSLDESQITALRNFTGQRAQDRQDDILKVIHAYAEDPYLKEFGIKISENLVSVEARILPAPLLKYHENGREKDCLPKVGQWNMREKKMVNAGAVNSWFCINFSSLWQPAINLFCYYLGKMCHTLGMAFNPYPVLPLLAIYSSSPLVASALKDQVRNAKTKLQGKELDLLIVILPNDSDKQDSLYGEVKRICETELGIVSQCCLHNHVDTIKRQYLENLALKINVKVGGRNTVLVDALSRRLPLVSEHPAIIFGADVNHPRPGEDSSSPSIAAVVASQDWPEMTKYSSLVSVQPHQQELIQDLFKSWQDPVRGSVTGGMIKELLISFYRATGHKPQRIIFYRGGVSESQLYLLLLYELDAIHEACASIETNYQPPVTFVVVQKRHNTRLFADNHADLNSVDSSRNILPGTVVDSKICHPTEFDFYLCSDGGIQDTSCPTHYHVLCDENKFTADELQSLTNNLCYTATCILCSAGSSSNSSLHRNQDTRFACLVHQYTCCEPPLCRQGEFEGSHVLLLGTRFTNTRWNTNRIYNTGWNTNRIYMCRERERERERELLIPEFIHSIIF